MKRWQSSGGGELRSRVAYLNGKPLELLEGDKLPDMVGECHKAGEIKLAPTTCTFIVI